MKTTVQVEQEWEKGYAASATFTRIRVLEAPSGSRVKVGTVTADGRAIRHREILVSALSNTPRGYRLVKEAQPDSHECGNCLGVQPETCAAPKPAPSPLARVREALTVIRDSALFDADREKAVEGLAALAPLLRALNAFASISEEQWRALEDACRMFHLKTSTGIGGAAICACGAGNGGSRACNALRTFQRMREDMTE